MSGSGAEHSWHALHQADLVVETVSSETSYSVLPNFRHLTQLAIPTSVLQTDRALTDQEQVTREMAESEAVQLQCAGAYTGIVTVQSLDASGPVAQARHLISGIIGTTAYCMSLTWFHVTSLRIPDQRS